MNDRKKAERPGAEVPGAAGLSAFQRRVYAVLQRVPSGRVTTYASLAGALQCGSARAVGQALKGNPLAPRIPCHRVIRADLSLGGYMGEAAGDLVLRKQRLLESEGVTFACGRLADGGRLFLFEEHKDG